MNTKNKQDQKNKRQEKRQATGPKKQDQNRTISQEHEYPEMRMTR